MTGFEDIKFVDQTRRNLVPAALVAIAGMGLPPLRKVPADRSILRLRY